MNYFLDLDDEEEFHTDHDDQQDAGHRHSTDTDSDVLSVQEFNSIGQLDQTPAQLRNAKAAAGSRSNRRRSSVVEEEPVVETAYHESEAIEEFGTTGDQTEEVAEENKGLLWTLLKQVRPGMDLSKVVLPTFILEQRSFLEKLSDYYYHCDILSQ